MTDAVLATKSIASKELEEWKAKGANLLLPSTHIEGLSEFHKPVLEIVQLSSNPENGDVYEHDKDKPGPKKKWRPTKQALMKLSVCAGVIWSVNETRRIDNGADRNYIAYRAVGGIKKADGQPVFFSAEYDMDMEVIEQEMRESYEKKTKGEWMASKTAKEKAEYVDFCVNRDLLQKRKFKLRLCEAGAMNRVLRMLLGIKQAYTTEELSKPFVVMRVVFQPDYNDKEVKKAFLDAAVKATFGIYGDSAVGRVPDKTEPIDITPIEEEPAEAAPENGGNGGDPGDPSCTVKSEKENFTPPDPALADFHNADADGQCRALTQLALKKGYNLADFQNRAGKTIGEMDKAKRQGLFGHLVSLADKQAGAAAPEPDDIPF